MNLILEQSHERVFSQDKGATLNALGLYIIRGDNMYDNGNNEFFSFSTVYL